MSITVETLLQAKSELARIATQPQIYLKPSALIAVTDRLRSSYNYVLSLKEDSEKGWIMNDKVCACSGMLLLQAWHISHQNERMPDMFQIQAKQLYVWLAEWEERLSSWTVHEKQFFETDGSWDVANQFLDVWYLNLVHSAIPTGRGCAKWLEKLGKISPETSTTYDQFYQRTVVTP